MRWITIVSAAHPTIAIWATNYLWYRNQICKTAFGICMFLGAGQDESSKIKLWLVNTLCYHHIFDIPVCGKINSFEPAKLWYIWKNEEFWVKLWWLPSRGDRWQVRQRGEELTLRWTKNYTMHNCSELKTAQCTTAVNWTLNTAVNTKHCRLQYNASALQFKQ